MSAKVIFQSVQRQGEHGREYASTKFEILGFESSMAGEVRVPLAGDLTVLLETKRRLRDLLHDALVDLEGDQLAAG
jgi:hypothetical protein